MLALRRLSKNSFKGAVGTRKFSSEVVVHMVQSGVVELQHLSGLPWYATFGLSSLFINFALFPLSRQQALLFHNLRKALPEMNALYKMLGRRLYSVPVVNVGERQKILSIFFSGVKSSLKLHKVSVIGLIALPIASIGAYIAFFYSLRSMIYEEGTLTRPDTPPKYGLQEGGMLWFKDLTIPDTTRLLPLISATVSYASLEWSLRGSLLAGSRPLTVSRKIYGIFQSLIIASVPFIMHFPSGFFCYWIPGSLIGMARTSAMRSVGFRKLVGLPKL